NRQTATTPHLRARHFVAAFIKQCGAHSGGTDVNAQQHTAHLFCKISGLTRMHRISCRMPKVRYLLIAAAAHVALTTTIFIIGHFQFFPNTFDQNGTGLTFALDGTSYQKAASDLAVELQNNGFGAWREMRAPFHSRLQSLAVA